MRTGPVLATDLVDKYQPLGAFGQPVYLSHVQLRAAVAQKLGPRHARYFARPDRDPQNKSIHWIAEVPGTARRWVDLAPEEQAVCALELQAMRSDFLHYLEELRQQPTSGTGSGGAAFASLLEQALLVPDDSHLYFVGDQPVVSFWGFTGFESAGFDAMGVAPRRSPVPPSSDPTPAPAAPAAAAIGPDAALAAVEDRRRPWWRWLLWALLAMLLLLLLLWLLRSCLPADEQAIVFGEEPRKEQPLEEQGFFARTLHSLGLSGLVSGGEGSVGPDAQSTLEGTTGGEVSGNVSGQPAPGTEKPQSEESAQPPQSDEPKQDQQQPPEQNPDETSGQNEPPKPDAPKPDESPAPPQPPGAQPESPPGSQQPDAPQAGQQNALQIPPDAPKSGPAGFLGGETWKSDSGLVDQKTGQPLQQSYQFDQQGKGEVTLHRADGSECKAAAQARMQNGTLSIEEMANATCPDGTTVQRSQTECSRTPSGQTVCVGRNPDGSTYRVGIQRQP